MRRQTLVTTAALLAMAGCQQQPVAQVDDWPAEVEINHLIIHSTLDRQSRDASVAERMIYPYHFEPSAAALNELGELHVQALAEALGSEPVQVRVPRGDASDELYDKRLAAVREQFQKHGMDLQKLTLSEGIPAGPGMASERLRTTYQNADSQEESLSRDTGGMTGGMTNSTGGSR